MPTIATASRTEIPVFRSATTADTAAIEQLLTGTGLPTAGVADLLASDATQFVVAVVGDAAPDVVAVAGLDVRANNALLRSVAVRADWQQHGLGRQLMQRVVCEAELRGVRALYLLTMTAEHYFPRFGFEVIARGAVPTEIANTLEFRSVCPASATAMACQLAPA